MTRNPFDRALSRDAVRQIAESVASFFTRGIRDLGFPRGFLIGPNSRGWPEGEVLDRLEYRRASEQCNVC